MKKILHIKAIWKFNFSHFWHDTHRESHINLSELFWNYFFQKSYLKHFIHSHSQEAAILQNISAIRMICSRVPYEPISAIELFFVYNVVVSIIRLVNDRLIWWEIHLVRWITHEANQYSALTINYDLLDKDSGNYLSHIISEITRPYDFLKTDTIVFECFWPWEIVQAIMMARLVKIQNPNITFVLNLENANEQFDYKAFIETGLKENVNYFDSIDYITPTKGAMQSFLQSSIPYNMFYRDGAWWIYKKWKWDQKMSVKEAYIDMLEKTVKYEQTIFWKKYVNIRLYPFTCYYNACFFCTINHGNEEHFPHKDKEKLQDYVNIALDYIEKEWWKNVNFIDEAIYPDALRYMMDQAKKRNIRFLYRFRIRFEKVLLDENFVKNLYQSGARYIGVWLESASPRINAMFNKWNDDLTLDEKVQAIKLFNKYNVPFHNYAIMGFPQETKKETLMTFQFLCNAITKMKHYTCTPNIYWLMRWSFVHKYPHKFGVQVTGDANQSILDFLVNGKPRDYAFLWKITREINKQQFSKYIDSIDPNEFWDFIDRSGIFYHFKVLYKKNPYHFHFENITNILSQDFSSICAKKIKKTPFFVVYIYQQKYILQSFVTQDLIQIDAIQKQFIDDYDDTKTIWENINHYTQWQISEVFIQFLIQNFILSNHGEDAWSIYNQDV